MTEFTILEDFPGSEIEFDQRFSNEDENSFHHHKVKVETPLDASAECLLGLSG